MKWAVDIRGGETCEEGCGLSQGIRIWQEVDRITLLGMIAQMLRSLLHRPFCTS